MNNIQWAVLIFCGGGGLITALYVLACILARRRSEHLKKMDYYMIASQQPHWSGHSKQDPRWVRSAGSRNR